MNFGVNLYNWFLTNAQSLVLMAIVVIGIYLGFKREFSKLIGFLVVSLIALSSKPYQDAAQGAWYHSKTTCGTGRRITEYAYKL